MRPLEIVKLSNDASNLSDALSSEQLPAQSSDQDLAKPLDQSSDQNSDSISEQPHVTRVRAWGNVTILDESDRYRINRIEILPGESMCMQMHHHRSEHWVIVSGTATVTCGDEQKILIPKQSTYVPMHTSHQVKNEGVIPLVMIEVQSGEYLGEDDIVRF